jgi:hypothetical protein
MDLPSGYHCWDGIGGRQDNTSAFLKATEVDLHYCHVLFGAENAWRV